MVSPVDTTTARGPLMLRPPPMPMDMVLATTDMPTTDTTDMPIPMPTDTVDSMATPTAMDMAT